jgi:predicted dehydrogenase
MTERLSVALVGCGNWGRHILRDLTTLGCEVVVVARSEASVKRARDGNALSVIASMDALPPVAGVVVASSTTSHAAVIEELLPLRIPIFVEKPIAPDVPVTRSLVSRAGERLFVMDKWRYHPGVEMLGSVARSGQLGSVLGVRTTRVGWGTAHSDSDDIWHLTPHDLSIVLEILGSIPPPRAAVIERENDMPTGMIGMLGGDPWVVLEVSGRRERNIREVRVIGTEAIAVLPDSYSSEVLVYRTNPALPREPEVEHIAISDAMPLMRELEAFVDHLRGGPPPRSSAAEGLKNVETIEALRTLAGLRPAVIAAL